MNNTIRNRLGQSVIPSEERIGVRLRSISADRTLKQSAVHDPSEVIARE